MKTRHAAAISLMLISIASAVSARSAPAQAPSSQTPRLSGLTSEEAAAFMAKVRAAQQSVKDGKAGYFDLLSGSYANYAMISKSPHDAFVDIDLSRPWSIERLPSANPLSNPYRLEVFPEGLGHLYWQIDVVINIDGDVGRVEMFYQAPAPF